MNVTLATLSRQHQEVLERLDTLERQLNGGADADLEAFASYLHADVVQHFALEEEALFPILGRHLSPAQGPLAVMNAEHADFRALLNQLTEAIRAADAAQQRQCGQDLIDLLRVHIAKEDQVLFPMAMRLLNPTEQSEVDARAAALQTPACAAHV